jgi:cytochrome c-type biogenesis protein CcmH
MPYFVLLIVLILVLTLGLLIRKLLQRRKTPEPVTPAVTDNAGVASESTTESAVEPAVAQPTTDEKAESRLTRYLKPTLIGLLILLPVCVIGLYLLIGSPQHLDVSPRIVDQPSQPDVEDLVNRLVAHLEANPDNAEGWFILGRTYLKLGRHETAVRALTTAHDQNPTATTKVALADALTLQNQGQVPDLAVDLLEQALALTPNSATTLWLLGQAAKQRHQITQAQDYWQRTLPLLQEQPEARAALQAQLDGLTSADPTVGLTVQVSLDPAWKSQVDAASVVYVYAKTTSGPPLAVSKHTVAELPLTVRLNDSHAMLPEHKLSQHTQVQVGARISQSGQAIAQSGDLISAEVMVQPAEQADAVVLVIDQKQP